MGARNILAPLLLAFMAFLPVACTSGRPAVSEELASAETLPVKKKLFTLLSGECLSFGNFSEDKVRRDSSVNVERPRHSRIAVELQEKYSFRMTGGPEAAICAPRPRIKARCGNWNCSRRIPPGGS